MGLFKKSALKKVLAAEKRQKKHCILLVDDEEHNLSTLADLLSDQYEILKASNGAEALELIRTDPAAHRIHIIISDQRMPLMTGVEFLERSLDIIPKAKRILLTGYTDVEAIIHSINKAKIFKFILKPFEHNDMRITVQLALDTYKLETHNDQLVEELQTLNTGLEEKVEERTVKLKEALDELHAINISKDRFFSVLAHDLKNPLHAFILTSETLLEDIDFFTKKDIAQLAKNLHKGSQNLYRLLENLLYWSQQQLKLGRFHPSLCALHTVTDQVTEMLSDLASHKEICINNHVGHEMHVFADADMLTVILRNLLSNAIKFSHTGGQVFVESSIQEDAAHISVRDEGVGMTEEQVTQLFQMEHKVTTRGTHDEKGTGLGLILCKDLVETHGGNLHVSSRPQQGATFTFTLPITTVDA